MAIPDDMWGSATLSISGSDFSIGESSSFYSEKVAPFTESAIEEIKAEAFNAGSAAAYKEITESPEMLILTGLVYGMSLEEIGKEVLRRGRLINAHTKPVS